MANDFIIAPLQDQWQIIATSDRGRAFAKADLRFDDGRADLGPAEALGIYQEIHERGYFAGVPDGLPPPGRGLILSRLALLLAPIVILVIFSLLA